MDTKLGHVSDVPLQTGLSPAIRDPIKPELFEGRHEGRLAKPLQLTQFGVNYVILEPGSYTSLRHWHEGEDEFVYVLAGTPTLIDENGEHEMAEGSFAAFPAGAANAHHFTNRSLDAATLLVVGSRKEGGDKCHYPDDRFGEAIECSYCAVDT